MIDADLYLRDTADGNLTADETNLQIVDIGPGGTGLGGVVVWVRVPTDSGTDTLDITVNHDDSATMASVDHTETFPQIVGGTTVFPFYTELKVFSTRRYVALTWNVTDTGGGVNFGAAEAGIKFGSSVSRNAR